MTEMDLEAGKNLLSLIKTTEKALENLNNWLDTRDVTNHPHLDRYLSLSISEHRDGSGFRLDLSRNWGNPRLLMLIKAELESQLTKFRDDFANL